MENDQVTINLKITPTWSLIKEVQAKAEKFMTEKGKSQEVIEAAIMCATELIENAVKYGSEKPDGSTIDFDLRATDDIISVTVTNGYHDERDLRNVIDHIEKIKASDDPSVLYIERLQQLLENPKPGVSQLGLYRIAYEGGFNLDYKHKDKLLTVVAEKAI